MTKLFNRLLILVALTAAFACALGVGSASARARMYSLDRSTSTSSTAYSLKHPAQTYSGEPDAGSGTAPKTNVNPTPATITPIGGNTHVAVTDWLLSVWSIWMTVR